MLAKRHILCYNVCMSIEDLISENIPIWRAMVTEAGGEYVGVQMPLVSLCDKDDEPRVIFTRAGSTTLLSLTVSAITQEAVNQKLGKKVTPVHLVEIEKVKFTLRIIAARIRAVANEIEEEINNAEK